MSDINWMAIFVWIAWFGYLLLVSSPGLSISLDWNIFWALPIIGSLLWIWGRYLDPIIINKYLQSDKEGEQ